MPLCRRPFSRPARRYATAARLGNSRTSSPLPTSRDEAPDGHDRIGSPGAVAARVSRRRAATQSKQGYRAEGHCAPCCPWRRTPTGYLICRVCQADEPRGRLVLGSTAGVPARLMHVLHGYRVGVASTRPNRMISARLAGRCAVPGLRWRSAAPASRLRRSPGPRVDSRGQVPFLCTRCPLRQPSQPVRSTVTPARSIAASASNSERTGATSFASSTKTVSNVQWRRCAHS